MVLLCGGPGPLDFNRAFKLPSDRTCCKKFTPAPVDRPKGHPYLQLVLAVGQGEC